MLIMNVENGAMALQIIGRDDVPRIEKEGRGWRDGAMTVLTGADVAKFLDVISGTNGEYEIGDSGLSMEFEYDDTLGSDLVILSVGKVSVRLTWPERSLLLYAIRNLAWKLFR
jgi:hypothetical protein